MPDFSSASSTTNSAKRKVPLKYFPPFNLEFTLPEEYPDDHPPKFQISAFWLSPLYAQKLSSKLAQIYYEIQDVILFHWVEFLRNEAIHFLDLLQDDTLDLVLKIDESGALDLLNTIIQYDRHAQYSVFQNSSFPCGICLSSCRGTHSFQFPSCSHVYCISCLSGYFTNLVSENRLNLVACPDSACMKSANATENLCTLAPETLAPLLSPETLQKLSDLSAKNSLESRKDIVWCPRRECQFPVPPDATDSRLGICPKCSFTFCKLCLRVWHGSHARCQVRNVGRLVREYQEANDFTRTQIERRYGKRALQALIANYQSEEASLSWISKHAIPCPSCGVGVTKSEGCNHMIVYTYFLRSFLSSSLLNEHLPVPTVPHPFLFSMWTLAVSENTLPPL